MARVPRISIVDNDASMRESLRGLLREMGFAVEVFASGEDFLASGGLRLTECAILDLRMQGMSGLDLHQRLLAGGYHVPVIFMTADPDEGIRARAEAAGAVGYLLKPFSDEALLDAVRAAVGPL